MGCVYQARNKINGHKYIGKAIITLDRRRNKHYNDAFRGSNLYFHKAIRKYGWENFIWKVLYNSKSNKVLIKKEIYYIKKYNTLAPNGYNCTKGGDGVTGRKHTDEEKNKIGLAGLGNKRSLGHKASKKTKKKMSISHMGNTNNLGKKFSDEWRKNISIGLLGNKWNLGRKASKKIKKKMSLAHMGNISNLGKKLSDEWKKNISTANTGKKCKLEVKKKISIANTGKKKNLRTKKKI